VTKSRKAPTALIILDGFGEAPAGPHNAVTEAKPAFIQHLRDTYPLGFLKTSGECVGLPDGLMGNSEVGHMNLGAGRVVWQDITRIDLAIREGVFRRNPAFRGAIDHVCASNGTIHLIGLVSDGGVHSSDKHLRELVDTFKAAGLDASRLAVHALLDGRDTPPKSGERYVRELDDFLRERRFGRIATVCGRYFAMDRDQRWDRVARAFRCLTDGGSDGKETADTPAEAVAQAYARGETDEFVTPTVVGPRGEGRVEDGDAVVFFNFRADRARELTLAFMDPDFAGFECRPPRVHFVTMTRYRVDFPQLGVVDAFAPQSFDRVLADVVADAGKTQLRIAETEKYAHVTYFFSGGSERERPGETRILVPSPRIATYDLQPEMSAPEVTRKLVQQIRQDNFDFVVLNLANPDMVGHTGILAAAVKAVRAVDAALFAIVSAILDCGGNALLTADHGNCEVMWDEISNCPHTAHTANPVPVILIGGKLRNARIREGGILADVSPTLLDMMDLGQPAEMTARTLIEHAAIG